MILLLKTRNVFLLNGTQADVASVLGNLQFKGLTELYSSEVSVEEIMNEFNNNKSIVCSNLPENFNGDVIEIDVFNSNSVSDLPNCINVTTGDISKQFQLIADSHNCDIGDHKSNSSGLNGAPTKKECPYCIEFASNPTGRKFSELNRILYQSDNFVVMPTVGEFIKGYLLIIPREHVVSLAELSPELREEFFEVLNDVVFMLKLTYPINDVLVWENGTGNGGIGKAKSSIVHAHVHVAPSQLTADKIQELSGFPLTKISCEELSLYGKYSYLLVKGDSDDEWWINDNPDLYIPRQYVRQLISDEYGFDGDTWNWRTNPFLNLLTATCYDIQKALTSNWESLPETIKTRSKKFLIF